jgi:hypothetical protein
VPIALRARKAVDSLVEHRVVVTDEFHPTDLVAPDVDEQFLPGFSVLDRLPIR